MVGMGLQWNPYSLPELKQLPKVERKRIWKNAWKKSRGRWQLILAAMFMGAFPWLANLVLEQYHWPRIVLFLLFLFAWAGGFAIYRHWLIEFVHPRIWEQIPGLCPRCGYDIRATRERCPECGHVGIRSDSSS
jgi:hypothetical protein